MGCGNGIERKDEAALRSKEIELMLKEASKKKNKQVKILLLGPGESGKSTIFKQMKIIQDNGGFAPDELREYIHIIHTNILSQMKILIQAAVNLQIPFETQEANKNAQKVLQLPAQGIHWNTEMISMIKNLWMDRGIKQTFSLRNQKYQLNETADYFFDHIDRFQNEFMPTEEDVLRVRVRSTGIEEDEFSFDGILFTMVDVGGQRSERRKWIHCFDSVTAVLFCASLSGYDQVLREDSSQNRMAEAILLFDEVSNSTWFSKNSIILFLNKTDLFANMIEKVPLTVSFADYKGGPNVTEASAFIKERFVERCHQKMIYVHFTCALDTKNIKIVIESVRNTLMNNTIEVLGF